VFFLMKQTGATPDEMDSILNKKSGLLGVSGVSSDMRDIENAMALGNKHAREAYNIFLHRLIHYIGGYFLILGGADAIVFTGGIGENGIPTRKKIVDQLNVIGCYLDSDANQCRGEQVVISTPESKVKALVTPTNEELMIAMETVSLMN